MESIINLNSSTLAVSTKVDEFSEGFNNYLAVLDLPTTNVLIEKDERLVVINNVPGVVTKLSKEQRGEAMYISKFIAACGAGLFDAALNFLWNETIINLRKKVIRFDLDFFLDNTVQDSKKALIKSEEDLKKIDDWEFIKGCKNTGIITDIGYKHLDYIRDIRNYASAAHPNQNNIDGLQVASWLQTCIKEVLSKEPEGPVIEIKKLIHNIRNKELTSDDTPIIILNIKKLPEESVDSLLRAIFGMYCKKDVGVSIKNNIKLIASDVWNNSSKQAKCETALKYATFAANGEVDRRKIADEFLTLVNGLAYLPNDQKIADMDEKLNCLYTAHYGYNNFYNEPIYAKELVKYIPDTGDIPEILESKYIKYILLCRLGNIYGVSEGALPHYEKMISLFTEKHVAIFCKLLNDKDVQNSVSYMFGGTVYLKLANKFLDITVDEHLKQALAYISEQNYTALSLLSTTKIYKQLMKKI